jgi:ABC-type phosphate/phosphonate transport system substrate-binding protein/rhodanese-related sulfurtransferase
LWSCLLQIVHADDALLMNVTLDYEERNTVVTRAALDALTGHLSRATGKPVKLIMTQNAERVGERVRTGAYSILLAPSQIVGVAMRHGYDPVAKTKAETSVAVVAAKGVPATSLQTAQGRRIALPHPESLVTYMLKGEMNAMGLSPSRHFRQVTYMNKYDAVVYAMDIGQADLIVAKADNLDEWLSRNRGARVIQSLPAVPAAGVVVSDQLDPMLKDDIRTAFIKMDKDLATQLRKVGFGTFVAADKTDFELVSTRGYYTPEVLPGATVVTAAQVKKLMADGVPLFDVRPQAHYRQGHIPGAINLTYKMNSPKEVDYDDSVDHFDLSRLPQDKNAPMIFQCNGAECWYSYKASRYAIKRGYKKVYWFRTGLPAWKEAGYPIEQSS